MTALALAWSGHDGIRAMIAAVSVTTSGDTLSLLDFAVAAAVRANLLCHDISPVRFSLRNVQWPS
jgi:hypothetical protein